MNAHIKYTLIYVVNCLNIYILSIVCSCLTECLFGTYQRIRDPHAGLTVQNLHQKYIYFQQQYFAIRIGGLCILD